MMGDMQSYCLASVYQAMSGNSCKERTEWVC